MRPLLITAAVLLCSCSPNNRNIVSAVQYGLGVSVSYNPQTQLPEGKVGYISSATYIIPTGLNTGTNGTGGTASDTPNMIVRRRVTIGFIDGVSIDDQFLIGNPTEIQQDTARALFLHK